MRTLAIRRVLTRTAQTHARTAAAAAQVPLQSAALRPIVPGQPQVGRRSFCAGAVEDSEPTYASGDLSGYKVFDHDGPFELSTGAVLPELHIAYETWGNLNAEKNNAILLQCGMSASSHACSNAGNPTKGWWEDYIGPGKALDTRVFYVICTNNLGGCYGTTGPSSFHPDGRRWGSRFPRFEVYDQVAAQFKLLDHLEIQKVHACVGSSLGGMQSVCAAARFPDRVGKFISISACAKSFPGSMAFRHAQRSAIMNDPNWNNGDYYERKLPEAGLRLAREIGTITYRSGKEWQDRFGQGRFSTEFKGLRNEFQIEKYLSHQGKKWVNNYDPNSMLWISKAMDGFTLELPGADGKPCLKTGMALAQQPALVIGVQHDVLFPVWQQKEIADTLRANGNKSVAYYELDSTFGHDTFLLSQETIGPAVKGHLEQEPHGAKHLWEAKAHSFHDILQAVGELTSTADMMRCMFRALSRNGETVEREELRYATKLFLASDGTNDQRIDNIFNTRLRKRKNVTLKEYLALREAFADSSYETYLP
mmetsp:Transcript_1107/g.2420  ORF Transcript_1107/g.2420 Transcript_1107/m.2420 type:complete len:535 (-) Transcript_1107:256-1860(-)|eukprot:CAMPEP_0206463504 /NCGR_PEP_ID=MMETSP0324_2-20121206/26648_1 /ASSEMBLY_ACC=CAM_ASM_000836 /TAXON_ID=2866 /ORGANISM="Crypthecodinium cohnii, Strain Seligo" /LENGTH=534 /DNA_ID=CAMNT_0053935933 /DNA_START=229 /DNA_END=1833 /DNA_ORIENTATION=-